MLCFGVFGRYTTNCYPNAHNVGATNSRTSTLPYCPGFPYNLDQLFFHNKCSFAVRKQRPVYRVSCHQPIIKTFGSGQTDVSEGVDKSVFRLLDGGISQSQRPDKSRVHGQRFIRRLSKANEDDSLFYNVETKCESRPCLNYIDQTPGGNFAIINTMAYYDVTGKQHSYVTCMDKTCSYQIIVTVYYATYMEPFREKLVDFSLLFIFRLGH